MTILEKLAIISDLLGSSGDNLRAVEVAASYFINSIPHELAKEFYVPTPIPTDGLLCGSKYSTVIRGKYRCRKIQAAYKQLVLDEDSQFSATVTDPVFYKENSKIFVLPLPTTEEPALVSKVPTGFIEDLDNANTDSIPNTPENAEHIILLYASYIVLYNKARTSRTSAQSYITDLTNYLSDFDAALPTAPNPTAFSTALVAPTIPTIDTTIETHNVSLADVVDLSYDVSIDTSDLDLTLDTEALENIVIDLLADFTDIDQSINDDTFDLEISYTSTLPDFDISGVSFPTIDLADSFTAIDKASAFLGKLTVPTPDTNAHTPTGVPTGAFWLDDEDPEMVNSAVQLAQTEIQKAATISNNQLSALNTYKSEIESKFTEFKAKAEAYLSEVEFKSKEAQSKLAVYQGKIQGRASELQARVQIIQAKLSEIQSQVNQQVSKLQLELQNKQGANQTILSREQLGIQDFSAKLSNYQSILQKAVQREQMLLQEWQGRVQQKIQYNQQLLSKFQNELGLYSNQFQIELNTWSANNNNLFQVFASSTNLAQLLLQPIQVVASKFQMENTYYSQLLGEAQNIYQKYLNEFNRYLSVYASKESNSAS